MANLTQQILAYVRQVALEIVRRETTHLKWATVTATSPVRIRYDGETTASIVPPQTTTAGLNTGDRVVVVKQHGQAVIVGPAGGDDRRPNFALPTNQGFNAQPGYQPTVYKREGRIWLSGGWSGSGMSADSSHVVSSLPSWARPTRTQYFLAVSNNASTTSGARVTVTGSGNLEIRPGTSLGSYYIHDGISWEAP